MKRTAYEILGVAPSASREEITAAYARRQAKLDSSLPENRANPDAEFQLKILREAFSLVDEPARRDAYDATLRTAVPSYPDPQARPDEASRRNMALIGLLFLATVGGGLYMLYDDKTKELAAERARVLGAKQEAQRRGAEEGGQAYEDPRVRQRRLELERYYEMEDARREEEAAARQQRMAEEAARRQAELDRQREEQEARAEQWRVESEAANQQYQSQREYRPRSSETGRGVAVLPPPGGPANDSGER